MKLKDGFVVRNISNVTYAVAVGKRSKEFSGMVKLSGIGEFLWNELQNEITLEALVDKVVENYEIDRATAEKDTAAFVKKLEEAKLFE